MTPLPTDALKIQANIKQEAPRYYGIYPQITQVGFPNPKETLMKCTVQECPGEYEKRLISQIFKRNDEQIVVEKIPAKVCAICGDTILNWEVVEQLWAVLDTPQEPKKLIPAISFEAIAV